MIPTTITEHELDEAGWERRIINGIMPEYSKAYAPDSVYEPARWRLVVRFNELIGETESGRAYLYLANTILPLFSIETLAQMEQLHTLLSFDKWGRTP